MKLSVLKACRGLGTRAVRTAREQKDLEIFGPIYREMKAEDDTVRLSFDHGDSGLMVGQGG